MKIKVFQLKGICSLLIANWISLFVYASQQQARNTRYPLSSSQRTIVTGSLPFKGEKASFWVRDFSKYINLDANDTYTVSTIISGNQFKLVLHLTGPVYVCPQFPGAAGFVLGSVFKNRISTRYVSAGMLVEPGDSINVIMSKSLSESNISGIKLPDDLNSIPFFNLLSFSGKGYEKLNCIQEIISHTKDYSYPKAKDLDSKLVFSDTVTQMILNTIAKYNSVISTSASFIIKACYIPMLAEDVSEIILNSGADLQNPDIINLYDSRIREEDKIIKPDDPALGYAYFYYKIAINRALLKCAIANKKSSSRLTIKPDYCLNYDEYQALKQYIPNGANKNIFIGRAVYSYIRAHGLDNDGVKMCNDFLSSINPKNSYYNGLRQYLKYLKNKFAKGNPAPDFQLSDANGKVVRLSDFKGKVVLIDFMFTGCVGCGQLVPELSKLESKYLPDSNIVFMSISISPNTNDESGWKAGIGKFSVASSLQLCAGGKSIEDGYNNPINRNFGISEYPQLVLIDSRGNFITNKAKRPDIDSGNSLTSLIDNALLELRKNKKII